MIMGGSIGIVVNEVLSRHVDSFLAEAETDRYPYAVYSSSVTPVYTKDGIHHYESDVVVTIYAEDLDKADAIADKVIRDMANYEYEWFVARMVSTTPDCVEGVWTREIIFRIKEFV